MTRVDAKYLGSFSFCGEKAQSKFYNVTVRISRFSSGLNIEKMKIGSAINLEAYVHLPTEVLQLILFFIKRGDRSQHSLWACCLVSRQWYSATVSSLYQSPSLLGRNFQSFSRTICPPVNAHIRRVELAQYVKHLDMSALAYDSSNSKTARLLRRLRRNLEGFKAPAKSFP